MKNRLRRLLPICFLLYMQGTVAEIPVPDPTWEVARAQFTSGIENREPVDQLVIMSPPATAVYFFTVTAVQYIFPFGLPLLVGASAVFCKWSARLDGK